MHLVGRRLGRVDAGAGAEFEHRGVVTRPVVVAGRRREHAGNLVLTSADPHAHAFPATDAHRHAQFVDAAADGHHDGAAIGTAAVHG